MADYSGDDIRRITASVNEAIDLAAIGEADWSVVTETFGNGFPEACVALLNQDFTADRVNFHSQINIDAHYQRLYLEHFAYINPWTEAWVTSPPGTILIAERDMPARSFENSEFYQDWLRPQGTFEGASGLKISSGPRDLVHMPVHYPLSLHESYDAGTAAVLTRIKEPLRRAVKLARLFSEQTTRNVSQAAIVGRFDQMAVVVDPRCKVRDLNERAFFTCSQGTVFTIRGNRLMLRDRKQHDTLVRSVMALAAGLPTKDEFCFETAGGPWLVQLFSIRAHDRTDLGMLFSPVPLILVLGRKLGATIDMPGVLRFSCYYGLTPAETRLCKCLADGDTVQNAAERLSITRNTARERLKSIFQKCGVNRQSELVRVILSFG